MKFRRLDKNEIKLIEECVAHFKGNFEINKFSLFADKFNNVFIYDGAIKNFNFKALSIGLNIGKISQKFIPNREFINLIKPTTNIFEIENEKDATNFMKGQDIIKASKKEKYKICTEKMLNFEEDALIAIKYKNMILGVGKFSNGRIINKISKREKLH